MFELASTAVFIFILCVLVGCLSTFLHYCIGEPRFSEAGAEFKAGRIFAFYGRWVSVGYQKAYKKEYDRINGIFQEEGRRTNGNISDIREFEIMSSFRPLVWQALGACPICFGTWISIIAFAVLLPTFALSIFWLSLCVPTSTIISGRIRI